MSDIFKKLQLVKDWIRQRLLQSFGVEGQSSRGAVVWSGDKLAAEVALEI